MAWEQPHADHGLYSEIAERACLGAAILDNSLLRGPLSCLAAPDFASSAHQELFSLMLQCDEDNQPFDESTLVASLEQSGKLDALGGIAYVSGLTDGAVEDPRLVSRHAQTVSRLSQLRRLRTLGERISDAACVRDADPALVLKSALTEIEGLENGCDLDGNLTPVEGLRSTRKADIATLATIEAKEVNWLWKPYLPAGMLAMLSGDPGTGKTFIALAVAADVTAGRVPCTNERSEPADVLYLSVENSPEHALRPSAAILEVDDCCFAHSALAAGYPLYS